MSDKIDIIEANFGTDRPSVKCLNEGHVTLVDVMPRVVKKGQTPTADAAIVQAARVSYGDGTKSINEDRGLIRYLMRHRHTTPMEMVEFKFHCMMPVFVARQWIRHRTANVNEYSARYSVVKDAYYVPDANNVRAQSSTNKQATDANAGDGDASWFLSQIDQTCEKAYADYTAAIEKGVAREQARMLLPVNYYTEWYWKCDAHNLLHFLALRCDRHAQQEIRVFGYAMLSLVKPVIPITIEAWEDYHPMRGGLLLTKLEVEAIRSGSPFSGTNVRECAEWADKKKRLGLA